MSPVNETRRVLLYASGSVSCFKSCSLISMLVKNGYEVQVAASAGALRFVGKASFEGLSHRKLCTDMFESSMTAPHIELAQKWADVIIAYPASANCINRLSQGLCDDLFGAVCLANNFKKPLLVAPAMNTQMFFHPAVQKSLEILKSWGTVILESPEGNLACGDSGRGRLIEPEDAFKRISLCFEQEQAQ